MANTNKISCINCRREFTVSAFGIHRGAKTCVAGANVFKGSIMVAEFYPIDLMCLYCEKKCKNKNSYSNHIRVCSKNPEKMFTPFHNAEIQRSKKKSNQYINAEETGNTRNMSIDSKQKISAANTGRKHSSETIQLLSDLAKTRGLGGHTSKRRMIYYRTDGTAVNLHSSYEVKLAALLDWIGIEWSRPEPLLWYDINEVDHRYYPDFQVGDIYIDTKNDYLVAKDLPKIEAVKTQNNVDVRIFKKEHINEKFIRETLLR